VIGLVQNGLNLMGVENDIRLIVTGLLLVLAVSIDKRGLPTSATFIADTLFRNIP
jgi:ribose/xylose/arabinose/galactoside ABC-type transport system permease subunit